MIVPSKKNNVTITSTAATKGKLYNAVVKCNTYYRDGVMEKRETISTDSGYIYTSQNNGSAFTLSNVEVYSKGIASTSYNDRAITYVIDNIEFYQMTPPTKKNVEGQDFFVFYIKANPGLTFEATNSKFYVHAALASNISSKGATGLFRFYAVDKATTLSSATAKFTNCDIIGADGKYPNAFMSQEPGVLVNPTIVENCRFYNFASPGDAAATNGTLSNVAKGTYAPNAADGWTNKTLAQTITKTYTVPAIETWVATDDPIQSLDYEFDTKEISCTFNTIATKTVNVTVGENTASLMPGVSNIYNEKALRVYAADSDNLLNTVYILKDANGNVYRSALGFTENGFVVDWENGYVLSATEETMLVGGIDAEFNLGFLSGFRYNLYIPVDARLSNVEVEGYTKAESTVLIGGVEYTVYSALVGTAAAADANTIKATFEVDGVAYSQTWSINAVQYAKMLINAPSAQHPNETAALGSMVKFIKDAVLTLDATADVTELEAIIASAGVDAGYKTYTEGNANAFAELIANELNSVQFTVYNGVASYKFILDAEGTAFSATVHGEEIGFTVGGTTIVLEPMRVYDLIDPITVTVGEITATVSMLDYLTAMEGNDGMNLAKSLYEFGVAADAYKQDIMANNN